MCSYPFSGTAPPSPYLPLFQKTIRDYYLILLYDKVTNIVRLYVSIAEFILRIASNFVANLAMHIISTIKPNLKNQLRP